MIARVPDYFEPIVGYRGWNVDAQGFLTSANTARRWKARKAVRAICTDHRDGEKHWHPETGATMAAPVAGCTCGYYAFKTDPVVDEYQCMVRGSVKLWGTIIEHESGYRAQFAYPFQLRCASAKLAARVRYLYGIECVVDDAMARVKTDSSASLQWFNVLTNQMLAQNAIPYLYPPILGKPYGGAFTPQLGQALQIRTPQAIGPPTPFASDWNYVTAVSMEDDVEAIAIPEAPSTWKGLRALMLRPFKKA